MPNISVDGQIVDNCQQPTTEKVCGTPFDTCMEFKVTTKNPFGPTITSYGMDCAVKYTCDKDLLCQSANSTGMLTDCSLKCCEGDLCNAGPTKTVDSTDFTVMVNTSEPTASGRDLRVSLGCLSVFLSVCLSLSLHLLLNFECPLPSQN